MPIAARRTRTLCGITWLLVPMLAGCGPFERGPTRIILIVVDTLRRDHLSPYGAKLATPNIQRLADRGQTFTNLQASYHQTTMSMAAMFTGRTPSIEGGQDWGPLPWTSHHWCGMARFSAGPDDSCIPQALPTLAERLEQAGYSTLGVVSNALLFAPSGYEQGFDSWHEVSAGKGAPKSETPAETRAGSRVNAAVEAALDEAMEKGQVGRLFLYVHYMDVHDAKMRFESYAESVEHLDGQIGVLLELLEQRGLLEDAVVILTSDHGEILEEKHPGYLNRNHLGNPSFQPVLEVPLIVSPAHFEDTDRFVRGQDVPGLIEQIAGIPPQSEHVPELDPDELFLSERVFITYRKGRFKSTLDRKKLQRWALYDLETDPGESKNVIEEHPEIMNEYFKRSAELAAILAAKPVSEEGPSEEDTARLEALGYLE